MEVSGSPVASCIGGDRSGACWGEGPKQRVPARNNVVWGNIFVDNCHPDFCPKGGDGRDKPWDTRPELIMPEDSEFNNGNVSDYNIYFHI